MTFSATSTLRSSNPFAQVPTDSALASTPVGMRSSRLDFDQLAQPTPVPTPKSSLSSALLETIATAVPSQPTKVSAQAMTPMIKKS